MWRVRFIALLPFICLPASAQNREPVYAVRGVVVDAGSLQPIAGAEVWLSMIPTGPPAEPGSPRPTESRKTVSSRSGTFSFEGVVEGRFPIEARKEGHIPIRRPIFEEADWVSTGPGEPEEVRLLLARQPRLSGRIVEADSGNPVEGIQVQALLAFYQNGRRNLFPVLARARSDSKGRFLFDSLLPAQYFLTVEADAAVRERIALGTSEEENAARGYLRTTWPDMRDLEVAPPFVLDPGAGLDVGDLYLAKGAGYKAVVRLHGGECGPGDRTSVRLSQSLGWLPPERAAGSGPCVGEFLVRGLRPGAYDLLVWVEGPGSKSRGFGQLTLTITDRDLDLDVFLRQSLSETGRVVAPEQKHLPVGLVIRLVPLVGLRFAADYKITVKADGVFDFPELPGVPHRMVLSGLGTGFYVKSMEYNGVPFEDGVVPLNPLNSSHSVVVTLGDGPAAVRGRVMGGDKPAREPYVVVVPWPARDPYAQSQQSRGDREGRFAFTGLAPGEYRIIAYREADGDKLDEPGVLPMLLRKAKSLTLQERSIQSIDVELYRP